MGRLTDNGQRVEGDAERLDVSSRCERRSRESRWRLAYPLILVAFAINANGT